MDFVICNRQRRVVCEACHGCASSERGEGCRVVDAERFLAAVGGLLGAIDAAHEAYVAELVAANDGYAAALLADDAPRDDARDDA